VCVCVCVCVNTHIKIYRVLHKQCKKRTRKNEAREKGRGRDDGDINGIWKLKRNGQK